MINSLFIEYETFLDANMNLIESSIFALKKIISKVDDIRIVCLGTKDEIEKIGYDNLLPQLSQALNLKKSLFFDKIEVRDWNDQNDVIGKISSWMSVHEVKSFAIVSYGRNDVTRKSYPNNSICCDPGSFSEANANDVIWIMSNFKLENLSTDIFVIGDCHFFHKNIIKYCNRPWHSLDENNNIIISDNDVKNMNNDLIIKWNSTISDKSIVYVNGDFCFGNIDKVKSITTKLNGRKRIILGNHDRLKFSQYYDIGFERVYDHPILIKQFIIISHTPLEWINDKMPYANIYAHVHNSPVYKDFTKNTFCSSVERINYTPKSLSSIIKLWKSYE